jgi:AcrR family transcriptional regulator
MRRRAEAFDKTRLRLVEAAMRLHTSVGPSAASLSAIAAEAGVTRVTLYRHFESWDELFGACMDHWTTLHQPPSPGPWLEVADLEGRVYRALRDLYAWYDTNGGELYPIYRDNAFMPRPAQAALIAISEQIADVVMTGISVRAKQRKQLRAALIHVVGFWTWRSLTTDVGLTSDEAAEMAAGFVLSVA